MSCSLWKKSHLHHPLVFHEQKYHGSTLINNEQTASKSRTCFISKVILQNISVYVLFRRLQIFEKYDPVCASQWSLWECLPVGIKLTLSQHRKLLNYKDRRTPCGRGVLVLRVIPDSCVKIVVREHLASLFNAAHKYWFTVSFNSTLSKMWHAASKKPRSELWKSNSTKIHITQR